MATNKSGKNPSSKGINVPQPVDGKRRAPKVSNLADFAPENEHHRLDEMDGQTIYIVKMDTLSSEQFGSGWKLWYKDMPNAADTMTVATFSKVLCPKLDGVYKNTHDGKLISLESPMRATVRVVGRTVDLV